MVGLEGPLQKCQPQKIASFTNSLEVKSHSNVFQHPAKQFFKMLVILVKNVENKILLILAHSYSNDK